MTETGVLTKAKGISIPVMKCLPHQTLGIVRNVWPKRLPQVLQLILKMPEPKALPNPCHKCPWNKSGTIQHMPASMPLKHQKSIAQPRTSLGCKSSDSLSPSPFRHTIANEFKIAKKKTGQRGHQKIILFQVPSTPSLLGKNGHWATQRDEHHNKDAKTQHFAAWANAAAAKKRH